LTGVVEYIEKFWCPSILSEAFVHCFSKVAKDDKVDLKVEADEEIVK